MVWIITLLISGFFPKIKSNKTTYETKRFNIKIYMYVMLKTRKLYWRELLIVGVKKDKIS